MTIPGMSSHGLPPNWDSLARRIQMLERQVKDARTAPTLEHATIGQGGIKVQGGSIEFVNALNQLLLTLDGTNGLTATDLGLIGNAALASPVTAKTSYGDSDNVTFTGSYQDVGTASLSVPTGFTTALVTVTCTVGASRTGGGQDFLAAYAWINGASLQGAVISTACPGFDGTTNGSVSLTVAWTAQLTGLAADATLTAGASVSIGDDSGPLSGWESGGGNGHSVMSATFFR